LTPEQARLELEELVGKRIAEHERGKSQGRMHAEAGPRPGNRVELPRA
jgi:hypothetical protein